MTKDQLKAVVRELVEAEVRRCLPRIVAEDFVRRVVAENVEPRVRRVQPPEALTVVPPSARRRTSSAMIPGLPSYLTEGVEPLDETSTPDPGDTGVDPTDVPGFDVETIRRLAGVQPVSKTIVETPEMKMRRIERQRAALDAVKVG